VPLIHLLTIFATLAAEPRAAVGEHYFGPPTEMLNSATLPGEPTTSKEPLPIFGSSVLEPLPQPELQSAGSGSNAIVVDGAGPSAVVIEPPEDTWLAWGQSAYLGLLGDEGRALAGFYDPFSYQFAYGNAGQQPYRLGWYSDNDFVLMPDSPTSIGGRFQDLEWNAWVRYARLNLNDTVVTWTGWANGKLWRGPAGVSLPSAALQFISDFQLASANAGPWNWQLGVTPQVNGSLEGKFNSNSLMVDGRAVLLYRASPQWLLALGSAFWNRATDHLIPYGGVIWAPDEWWELRFMFPKSRASYYLGRFRGTDTWIYAAGEYNLEAYQVDFDGPKVSTRGQTSGYRSFAGVTMTTGIWTLFAEAGIVTDRHFRFRGAMPDFTIGDCAFLRSGLLF
jgi:hypothetical protein